MAGISSRTAGATYTVALVGNPNTGKSTLFNALAGLQTRVGNYPGVTVEKKIGRVAWGESVFNLVDLPGTYSLSPRTPDEMISVNVLLGRQRDVASPDAVICIVDASNLERNMFLLSQVLEMQVPVVVVLNMYDVAEARGMSIDVEKLAERLNVPVVVTQAHRRRGIDLVREAVAQAVHQVAPQRPPRLFPDAFYAACDRVQHWLGDTGTERVPDYLVERMLLDSGGCAAAECPGVSPDELSAFLRDTCEALNAQGCRVPAIEAKARYAWIRGILDGVLSRPSDRVSTMSDRIDHVLTHRLFGLAAFCILIFLMFQSIYAWAGPFMDVIESAQSRLSGVVVGHFPPGPFRSLLADGVIAGVGSVIVFVPQIAILFFFIAVLEDCGYMSRAAFLMDKLMAKVGLSGKSFVPLMSSFACAIPGVMATRVIEDRRDRLVTMLVAPLMSCSARLPVYLLLIAAFVPPITYLQGWITLRGLVLFGMSSLGALVAIPMAWFLRKTLLRGETPPFVMELPCYKWPSPGTVLSRVFDRVVAFVTRAGTLIFATTILVWAAGYFPGDHAELDSLDGRIEQAESSAAGAGLDEDAVDSLKHRRNELSSRLLTTSFLGRVGHAIEPAIKPLGWDWRIGVGAIASFPAREVIIATLGTIYSLGADVTEDDQSLISAMHASKWPDGRKVYNVPVALSVMVFFALCAQCAATLAVIKRETNSWRWPIFTFVYMTVFAYLGALVTYQTGMLFS